MLSMRLFNGLFVALCVHVVYAQYNPLKNPQTCGRPQCTDSLENRKFHYEPDTQQTYSYAIDLVTFFNGTSTNKSLLHVEADVVLDFVSECDGLLSISDVRLTDKTETDIDFDEDYSDSNLHPNSEAFGEELSQFPLRFSFQDGVISEVCPDEEEKNWVLNFKRGVLSLLHNTMKRFDLDHNVVEEDVRGICDTSYKIRGASGTSLVIEKTKDLNSCQRRTKLHSFLQSSSYNFRKNTESTHLIQSTNMCELSIDHYIYNDIQCTETHVFQPFSNQAAGATTVVKQRLTLQKEIQSTLEEQSEISRRTSLLYDHVQTTKPTSGELKTARDSLKQLCKLSAEDLQSQFSDLFTKFIHTARLLSHVALSSLFDHAGTICVSGKKHMLDALPYLGSSAAVSLMKDSIINNEVSENVMHDWMLAISFIPRPTEGMMETISQLLEQKGNDPSVTLGVSALTHTFCTQNLNCYSNEPTNNIIQWLENQVVNSYESKVGDRKTQENMLIALKAIANIGTTSDYFKTNLFTMIQDNSLDITIRVTAVQAFRRFTCEEFRPNFETIFRNQDEDVEIRIASYLQIMRCPNYLVIRSIRHSLQVEEVNQVGSFIWSHLHNLLKSSIPSRVEIQSLLSDQDLGKKFSSDVRKFSHNYEGSMFVEEYNIGASYESNVIFSPSSYIPRAAMLNLTVDLFGESINLLEVDGRIEGFEHYLESIFGPKRPFNSQNLQDKIPKMRWSRSVSKKSEIEALPNPINNNFNEPKVSLGFKVFGNELKYSTFNGEEEIKSALRKISPIDSLKHILSGKEINYNKATMFLDSSYILPSGAGFPLTLNAVGTAAVNIKLFGALQAANFTKTKELDLVGDACPSAAVDVVGTMSVDAYYASTAIKLKTNMYTSSAVEGSVKIRGSNLVSVKFSLPKGKTEIFGAQSELIVMNGDNEQRQTGLDNKHVSQSVCSWPVIDKIVGLKLCAHYHFTNVTKIGNAPYFILAGPAGFGLSLEKADPTAKTYFLEYKWNKSDTSSGISFTFDTPGSSVPRLSGINLTLDRQSDNVTLLLYSPDTTMVARGKYKNTDTEKYLQVALDIDDKKHLDASLSLQQIPNRNGYTYIPKVYLGVNGERVAELQGSLKWVTKKGISQCDVDLKFQTKRLTSKVFGYISKSDASIGTNLKLDYKFINTREQRAILAFSLANRSTRPVIAIIGNARIETTAYPHFNFDAALKFQKAAGRMECKLEINSSPNLRDLLQNDPNRLLIVLEVKHKTLQDGTRFETKASVTRAATDLDLSAELSYAVIGPNTDLGFLIKYAKEKEVRVTLFWSHPRATFEHYEGYINVTVPFYTPMFIGWKAHEKRASNYDVELSATWFSGHNVNIRGMYQDKSSLRASSHHLKVMLKSPSFQEIDVDCQYYRDNTEIKIDLKANHKEDEYGIFYKHVVSSPTEISTKAKIKYKTQVYSVTSVLDLKERKQLMLEFHFDQYRDVHLAAWAHNKKSQKTAGLEIKWDANRDPNQKLAVTVEFSNPESYNYAGSFVISYPGRTINGILDFIVREGHFLNRMQVAWSPTRMIALKLSADYRNDIETLFVLNSEFITPIDEWKKTSLNFGYRHADNMYRVNGSMYWYRDEHVSVDLFRDYKITNVFAKYELHSSLSSTLKDFPSFSTHFKHYHNTTSVDTSGFVKYKPKQVIAVKSSWHIDEDKNMKNLTGTVSFVSPFAGYTKGLLVSKIYVTNRKDLRGVADLDFDYKKYTVSVEGHYHKISKNMFVFNITTPMEKYKLLTGRLGILEEEKHAVALIQYPTGTLGVEVKLLIESLKKFDVKFYAATPIEFIQKILVVGNLQNDRADFRIGWNSLMAGFSGVWHYAHVTDFEYSYKIYTPIKGFEQNGIVAKFILKEGLDFEISVKLAENKLGVTVVGKPKPKLLDELGIKTQAIYNRKLVGTAIDGEEDDEYEDEDEMEDPISWSGLVEIDSLIYPTMKGTLDIDQKGTAYVLLGTLTLPGGTAELKDEFDFADLLTMKNRLHLTTPYDVCKVITSNYDLRVMMGFNYYLLLDLNYQNGSKWINTGGSVHYKIENEEEDEEVIHNLTVHIHTPFNKFPRLDHHLVFKMEENIYGLNFELTTIYSYISLDGKVMIDEEIFSTNAAMQVTSSFITIPPTKLDFKKDFSDVENRIEMHFNMMRATPINFNVIAAWKFITQTNFKVHLIMETPFRGMEKAEIRTSVAFAQNNGLGELYIFLHPIHLQANGTVKDNQLRSWITSEFKKERREMMLQCKLLHLSQNKKEIRGDLKVNDKVYAVNGTIETSQDNLPVSIHIQIDPEHGGVPFHMEYQLQFKQFGHVLVAELSQGQKFIHVEARTTSKLQNELNVHIKVATSNKRYTSFVVDTYMISEENSKNITLTAQTPFQNLENPRIAIQFLKSELLRNAKVDYQLSQSRGTIEGEWCWIYLENMAIKVISNQESEGLVKKSTIEGFYLNPNKTFNAFQMGGDADVHGFGTASTAIKLALFSLQKLNLQANLRLPNSNVHIMDGHFHSTKRWDNIDYSIKYHTQHSDRKYGSIGKVSYTNKNHLIGDINVEWNKNQVNNYLDVENINNNINLLYKLRTPKFRDQDTLITKFNYKSFDPYKNVTCQIFYPANRSVAATQVDFQQFANMNGTMNVTTPFKKFPYLASHFRTKTTGLVIERYIKLFWPKKTAFIDSKCNIIQGNSALERDTIGVLLVEVPLTTKHVGQVDYTYFERPNNNTGQAIVDYNKEKILEGRYNCLSESRAGYDKDTIHVELENKVVPVGVAYVHGYEYSAPRDGYNTPTTDSKRLEVYHLHNRTGFNVTGEMLLRTTFTGRQIALTAIHSNRIVKFWTDYDVLDQQFKQHSKLELAPTVWISYDLDMLNKTRDENEEAQQIQINLSYPRRNFTALGSYSITNFSLSSEMLLQWDEQRKTLEAAFDWKRDPSPHRNQQQVELQFRHPSFVKNVSILGEYEVGDKKLLDLHLAVDYSDDPNKKFDLRGLLLDYSDSRISNYTYKILGNHLATNLILNARGGIEWKPRKYQACQLLDYKRTYLPMQSRETSAWIDFDKKEIELKKKSLRELSYFWGGYAGKFPLYTANISAIHGKDINASGEFYLNFREKLIQLELNMTEDGSQSLHVFGEIPDARSAFFNMWRDYEDIRVSDISYFLRLNHSRLIVSNLRWRPEIKRDMQNGIRALSVGLYKDIMDNGEYWKQYIRSETANAIADIWQDATIVINDFLEDLKDLKVVEKDIEELKLYLEDSYKANEFYIRDIVDFIMRFVDELAIRPHLESLPKIFNEIWEVMGDSGKKIQKGIIWVIEKVKSYYKNTAEFVNGLFQGNAVEHISEAFSQLIEKYDNFIKGVHVSFIRYMENLWKQTYLMILENWHKTLAAIEPTFLKIIHYLETVAWNTSKEFLDFLYIRKAELVESPYFSKFSDLSHDVDKFYKDVTGNNTIWNVYKYTVVMWNFVKERYFDSVPFGKELHAIVTEIVNELHELRHLPSIKYLTEKYKEVHDKLKWFYDYFEIEDRVQQFLTFLHVKLTDLTQTALEAENRYREAKTKFVFEPREGIMYLEQKLPMSWHAFNETPKIQEIPEYKAINDLQNYFVTSKTSFWSFYYDYKPYTDPTDWFPPFKAQAMIAGSQYYVTFDRTYYNFRGGCSYLLVSDFLDRNFSIAVTYNVNTLNLDELVVLVNNTVLKIDMVNKGVKVGDTAATKLPLQIGDLKLYQDADIVTFDSESGFLLQCNLKFDVCMLETSGWYFGKTAGLWGTMNNEPSDDLLTGDGRKTKVNDINTFTQSWAIDKKCSATENRAVNIQHPPETVQALCEVFFTSKMSPFVTCFLRVPNAPFLNMCLNSFSEKEACTSAVAYMKLCAVENTPLRIPEACVKCNLLNGTTVAEGEFIRFEGDAVPWSTDVVFIIEAKECNRNLRSKRNIDILTELMHKEFLELNYTNNRYSVVAFGGNGVFDQPRSIVINSNIFEQIYSINPYFNNIPVGSGNSDVFGAIIFATKLVFRPGVSKTFILLPCTDCHESNMKLDYAILHQLLLENDITLHILMNEEFQFRKTRMNKIFFGIDRNKAYTKKDVKDLKGDRGLLKQVRLPKSTLGFCTSLALETNGSVFTGKKLEADKKNAVKRFSTVFSKRVAQTAIPSKCQMCECTAPNTGVSYMECFPCSYPTPAIIDYGFNEDETLSVMQPVGEEELDYSGE